MPMNLKPLPTRASKSNEPLAIDYKQRLYQLYLSNQQHLGLDQAMADLARRAPYLRRLVRSSIPADRTIRILDIGCGYGALLHFLKEAGYINLFGVDRSPEQVVLAHEMGLDFVHEGNLAETFLGEPNGTYDVVVAFDVLEHLTCEEALRLGDELFRIIRPGGRLILHLPNAEGIFSSRILYGDMTHERAYTRSSVTQLMSACGFSRVTITEDRPVLHSLRSAIRLLMWKALRSLFRLVYLAETGDARQPILSQNFIAVAERP